MRPPTPIERRGIRLIALALICLQFLAISPASMGWVVGRGARCACSESETDVVSDASDKIPCERAACCRMQSAAPSTLPLSNAAPIHADDSLLAALIPPSLAWTSAPSAPSFLRDSLRLSRPASILALFARDCAWLI
ncbi:MAG: hypothetical protein HYR88_03420 [Verrucomicrobia bacterium]|nr:hypothetical protein [Verrucomicrobiota bacterium]MBI3871156.1 hypothetical protein [Verrucomicrobiota bacterium]